MTDIKVIVDAGPSTDVDTITHEERGLLFDKIAADNPRIPRAVIDAMAGMQEAQALQVQHLLKPELKELLLRKIIQLGIIRPSVTAPSVGACGSNFNTLVIPITARANVAAVRGGNTACTCPIVGGAIPMIRRIAQAPTTQADSGGIKIRFDVRVFATTEDGVTYIVPAGEELDVIGVVLNPICARVQTAGGGKDLVDLRALNIVQPTVGQHLMTGAYTYADVADSCDEYFLRPGREIVIAGERISTPHVFMFMDGGATATLNSSKTMTILSSMFDYIAANIEYVGSMLAARSVHTQIDIAVAGRVDSATMPALVNAMTVRAYKVPMPVMISGPRAPILDVLETIHHGRFSTVGDAATVDVIMRGFSRIYQKAVLKGRDNADVLAGIDAHKARAARLEWLAANHLHALDEENKLGTYRLIIEKKLGPERLKEVDAALLVKPSLRALASNILTILNPAERKPIELEFAARAKYFDEMVNNKCPHVGKYRQFRRAVEDIRARQLYSDLRKYFVGGGDKDPHTKDSHTKGPHTKGGAENIATSMIKCNACGFDIMCPHIRDFTELDQRGASQGEIKAKLTKYIDRGGSAVVRDQYYCRICGETISSLEAFSEPDAARDPASQMDDELKNFMWSEIAGLTKYLKFGGLIDVPKLITTVRDVCYPFIFEIEKQILKSKTNSVDEIKSKKRLYITIYAFAYFVHLLLSNRRADDIGFRNYKGAGKSPIVDLIKHALEVIVLSRNIIIREIPGMSPDIIKNTLIEAYKSMVATGSQVITYSGEAEGILNTLLLDPVYDYYYAITITDEALHGRRPSHKKFDRVDRVDDIMGSSIARLDKAKGALGKGGSGIVDIFAAAKVPTFDNKWGVAKFTALKPLPFDARPSGGKPLGTKPSGGKPLDSPGGIALGGQFAHAYPGYMAKSFEMFTRKMTDRVYLEHQYIDVSNRESKMLDVKFRPIHQEHHDHFLELAAQEATLMQYKTFATMQVYRFLPALHTRLWSDPGAQLSRIYDEDGVPHDWSIYIVDKSVEGKLTRAEYTNKSVCAAIEAGTRFDAVITDKKCSRCGVLWSATGGLSDVKIRESLRGRRIMDNFFRFYENRCPKSGLHEFVVSGGSALTCAKCALVAGTTPTPYYHEFKETYERERQEFTARDVLPIKIVPPMSTAQYDDEYVGWAGDFNVVLDLANKLKINHRVLSALGAVERQEYADVMSGAYLPVDTDDRYSTRAFTLSAHIKTLITEYNQLKYFHKLTKPPPDLSAVVEASGYSKHKISELAAILPDIFNDFNVRYAHMLQHKKPRETIAFCIQTFCTMCLAIWNDPSPVTEKLRRDFTSYIVKKILRGEELMTKPGHFNWSLIFGDNKEKAEVDYNVTAQGADAPEDDNDPEPAPFDTDAFDMEEDGNGGDDDDRNEIHVGEDRGLD